MKKQYYNEKEATKYFGISEMEMYLAVRDGEIEVHYEENENYFHWSDLMKFNISRKTENHSSANFGLRKAAKYLGISQRDLESYTNLRWIKTKVQADKQRVYSEADLDRFVVKILAPISKIIG